jgi:hypothetical protein
LSKKFAANVIKEYVSRSGQRQQKLEEIMLQLKKRTERYKNKKDEINKIKSRGLFFLEYPQDGSSKLL